MSGAVRISAHDPKPLRIVVFQHTVLCFAPAEGTVVNGDKNPALEGRITGDCFAVKITVGIFIAAGKALTCL